LLATIADGLGNMAIARAKRLAHKPRLRLASK
jgi:hypothetical protein